MQKTNIGDEPFGRPRNFPLVIADMPITARERRFALGIIILLVIAIAIVGPFSTVPLGRVDAFKPVLQTVMCVITAAILFGQYSIRPKLSLRIRNSLAQRGLPFANSSISCSNVTKTPVNLATGAG